MDIHVWSSEGLGLERSMGVVSINMLFKAMRTDRDLPGMEGQQALSKPRDPVRDPGKDGSTQKVQLQHFIQLTLSSLQAWLLVLETPEEEDTAPALRGLTVCVSMYVSLSTVQCVAWL